MHSFRFNPKSNAPIVTALVTGPRGTRKLRLIFDTGAERTQIHTGRLNDVGYSSQDAIGKALAIGVGGLENEGYVISLQKLFVLASVAERLEVAVFDMKYLKSRKLDGLLGWDVIRAFHLEMDGPKGLLKVF